jgi:hypothetical protein
MIGVVLNAAPRKNILKSWTTKAHLILLEINDSDAQPDIHYLPEPASIKKLPGS